MNREIKFRAYEANNKKMYGVKEIQWTHDRKLRKVIVFSGVETNRALMINYHSVILMQSSGLKDRNGVEIYEGDIIEYYNPGGRERGYVQYQDNVSSFVIDYWKKGQNESRAEFLHELATNADDDGIEIIGNIYESKHLLDNTDTRV